MKKIFNVFILLLSCTLLMGADIKVVPLVNSNPTSGTGGGLVANVMYQADENSAASQLMAGALYTTSDSYALFGVNKAYFQADSLQSITGVAYIKNKSQFQYFLDGIDLPIGDIPQDILPPLDGSIRFDVDVLTLGQMLLYRVDGDFFLGGHVAYVEQKFSNPNTEGTIFLTAKGVEDSSRGAFGADFAYDTRSTSEKLYPRDAIWIQVIASAFLKSLGVDEDYYTGVVNARIYKHGFKPNDVWANQFFGKYTTKNAPDGGLAALGARGILRGFAIGQFKARYLNAFQSEYRYQIENTNFRAVAFAGIAQLSGGSKGTTSGIGNITFNRDSDNGTYYSGGVGARYTLNQKQGLDFRVDLVQNSKSETSLYAQINQAF